MNQLVEEALCSMRDATSKCTVCACASMKIERFVEKLLEIRVNYTCWIEKAKIQTVFGCLDVCSWAKNVHKSSQQLHWEHSIRNLKQIICEIQTERFTEMSFRQIKLRLKSMANTHLCCLEFLKGIKKILITLCCGWKLVLKENRINDATQMYIIQSKIFLAANDLACSWFFFHCRFIQGKHAQMCWIWRLRW